jgi:trigger factor
LDIKFDKTGNSEAFIKISLKENDNQPQVTQKIKEFSKKANIKGFRPGKVPPGLIRQMYGSSILGEEINKIVSDELNKFLKESDLQFLGEPMPSDNQENIDWTTQKEFDFNFNVGYTDGFDLKIDKKFKVDRNNIKVDDKVINETIENLQKQFGEVTNPETVGESDTIYGPVISKDGSIEKEVSIEFASLNKSFSKNLVGSKVGDTFEIDTKKSFNDKEHFAQISHLTSDELKSVKNKLNFTLKGITHTAPAEINQDLFDKTFGKDAVKTESEFRDKVKLTISKNYESESLHFFHHKIREKLLDKTKIVLPNAFLKKWLVKTNEKMTEDALESEFDQYAGELKWSLIRNKIAKDQDVKVEHEEIVNEAKILLAQQFGGPSIIEQLGDQMDALADNYLKAENGDNYMKVFNQLQSKKVYGFLEEQISIKEKEVSLDEFRKL